MSALCRHISLVLLDFDALSDLYSQLGRNTPIPMPHPLYAYMDCGVSLSAPAAPRHALPSLEDFMRSPVFQSPRKFSAGLTTCRRVSRAACHSSEPIDEIN